MKVAAGATPGLPGPAGLAASALAAIGSALLVLAGGLGLVSMPAWGWWTAAVFVASISGLSVLQARFASSRAAAAARTCDDLRRQLELDPLTHLMNRTAFNRALEQVHLDQSGAGVIILFFDLDRFKDVNDSQGHRAGDQLLVEVARRAASVLGDAAAFARLGGDEFAAIIPWVAGKRPEDYGRAIVEVMNEPFLLEGRKVEVSASVGIALGEAALDDGHELLRRADLAMYEAKGGPRGACHVYDDILDGRQIREGAIRVALGRSVVESAFVMHFQPIVDARTGLIASAEALLRTQSAELKDVPISSLIAVAEECGHIIPLTDWTIDTVLAAIRQLETVPIAVNVSPIYFRRPDFVHRVFDKLLAAEVRPELLTIEVTEGVAIADMGAARHSIARLREMGVKVFLDDFGTGYSSLAYLQHLELDGLKIDKSFLRDMGNRNKANGIIRSIIDVGHSFDMKVVVEGVESDWQARLLQLLGCDLLQGYELGVPMPLCELEQLVARQRRGEPLGAPAGRLAPTLTSLESRERTLS